MRLLIIADPHIPVPPVFYGGAERVIARLCEGLAQEGHVVDLMAGPGSKSYGGRLHIHQAPSHAKSNRAYRKLRFQLQSAAALRNVDLVVNFGRVDYLWTIAHTKKPLVVAFENPALQSELDFVSRIRGKRVRFVGVSRSQIEELSPQDQIEVVFNATDTELFQFVPSPSQPPYFVFLGRLTANKGVHLAIDAAQRANVALKIAGAISDEPGGCAYFETHIQPRLGGNIEWIGAVDDAAKKELLGGATAMLFPIQWKEPCAVVIPEALACGCPVIGWRNGSVPEVLRHGETGFVVDSIDEMATAIGNIHRIDRAACRRDAEERFSSRVLVQNYLAVFERAIAG